MSEIGSVSQTEIVRNVQVVDSHTGGEPTRLVIQGGPDLTGQTLAEMRADFAARHDAFRSGVVNEPRGSDVMVGALLVEPVDPTCTTGVIFFNNVGMIGMCGHGTIGVIASLAYLGRLAPGFHRIETAVGVVTARLHDDGSVSVQNVPAYRFRKGVSVVLEDGQQVTGDVAWGGNWFFMCDDHDHTIERANIEALTEFSWRIRNALTAQGITGRDGGEIDHIELTAPSPTPGCHSRNFVLCPGKAYDRSPCGTGTSAKLACLAADGKLQPGEIWRQESVIGSVFEGYYAYHTDGETILPTIRGRAWVNACSTLIFNPADPYCYGIPT